MNKQEVEAVRLYVEAMGCRTDHRTAETLQVFFNGYGWIEFESRDKCISQVSDWYDQVRGRAQDDEWVKARQEAQASLRRKVRGFVWGEIEALNKHRETAELSGEDPLKTHEDLATFLEEGAAYAREIEGHAHQWNEDDYCSICGADGRA